MLNSSKNTQNDRRYIVVDEPREGFGGDIRQDVYDSLDEANKAADLDWWYLTASEKRKRHIYVGVVRLEDLNEWAFDEDTGAIDWAAFHSISYDETMFDSEEYERHDVSDYEEIQKHMLPEAKRLVRVWEGQKDSEFLERYNEAHKLITGKEFGIFCGGDFPEDFEIYDKDNNDNE